MGSSGEVEHRNDHPIHFPSGKPPWPSSDDEFESESFSSVQKEGMDFAAIGILGVLVTASIKATMFVPL